MTEPELKSLSEFATTFSGDKLGPTIDKIHHYFENDLSASYAAHLALQEMEKRGYKWSNYHFIADGHIWKFAKREEDLNGGVVQKDENNFIALWSAIDEAMKQVSYDHHRETTEEK